MKEVWLIATLLIGVVPAIPWTHWQVKNRLFSIPTNIIVIIVWGYGFTYLSLSLYNKIYLGCFGIGCAS